MLRSIASTIVRRSSSNHGGYYHGRLPIALHQRLEYHVTSKRDDDTKFAPITTTDASSNKKSMWDPIYAVPIGIAFAVPAVHYEWYLVNEETQLMACFIMFTALIYKNFGPTIGLMLEEDGKRIIEEANKVEDTVIDLLQSRVADIKVQENIVEDARKVHQLKLETYEKLNAAGQMKPLHEYKVQMERVLSIIATEEASMIEKAKTDLMKEATIAVTNELLTNKDLQKVSLENAIAQLKGTKPGMDPVKQTYLQFFQWKSNEAKKIDGMTETIAAREILIKKINAIASNEKFFFQLDPTGTPKMVV